MRAALGSWLSTLDLSVDVQLALVLAAGEATSNAIEPAYPPEPSPNAMVANSGGQYVWLGEAVGAPINQTLLELLAGGVVNG
jgi:hypothetical protein